MTELQCPHYLTPPPVLKYYIFLYPQELCSIMYLFFFTSFFFFCLLSLFSLYKIHHPFPIGKKKAPSVSWFPITIFPSVPFPHSQASWVFHMHCLYFFPTHVSAFQSFFPYQRTYLHSNCQWPPGFKTQLIHLIPSLLSLLHAICRTTELLWNPPTLDLWDVLYYMSSCFAARYSLCFPQHSLKTHVSQFYS